MISVVIPTLNSERVLMPTLAALVAGAATGLVREVVFADGGSRDGTAKISDEAGCEFLKGPADPGARFHAAAEAARGSWLMFLDPAATLEEGWTREVRSFIETAERTGISRHKAATFRLSYEGFGIAPRLKEAAAVVRFAVIGRPRSEQGLLISKKFYQSLGGHGAGELAHERLIARIGRRIVALRTRIMLAAAPV